MLPTFLALALALFLVTSTNALSLDSSVHLARHQHIAARHAVERSPVNARCKKRNPPSSVSPSTPASSSQALPPSSSSSQAPSPSSSPSSGPRKAGIGWSQGPNAAALQNFITGRVSYVYTWSPTKPPLIDGLTFAPMLWGEDQISQFQSLVKPGYAKVALAFNEPDLPSQSNLDPETAAQIWMKSGQPLRNEGYKLITPAVAYESSWLTSFLTACNTCTFDFMAAHIYTTDAQTLITYLTNLHNEFGLDIWVTEFACQDFNNGPQANSDQAYAFMSTVTQWMDQTEWIAAYFAYGVMSSDVININPVNALMNADGTPNALGRLYLGI